VSRRRRALFEAVYPWGSCRVRPSCADAGEIPSRPARMPRFELRRRRRDTRPRRRGCLDTLCRSQNTADRIRIINGRKHGSQSLDTVFLAEGSARRERAALGAVEHQKHVM